MSEALDRAVLGQLSTEELLRHYADAVRQQHHDPAGALLKDMEFLHADLREELRRRLGLEAE